MFDDPRKTITKVMENVWQGAMPLPGSDLSGYGAGARIYVLRAEVAEPRFVGAEVVYVPLVDNANEPVREPPVIYGTLWGIMDALADEVAQRQRDGKPTISVCQWGYNRSGLLVGLAMAKLGLSFDDLLARMRQSRGPHPEGFGEALNNHNFREYVRRHAR